MLTSKDEIVELALELAWSHWAELGVSGWVRRHTWQAIDLEPLIIFTAVLGDCDARLRDESLDWCVVNARFISAVRLRNLSRLTPGAESADRYAATMRAHSGVQWPGDGEPLPFQRTNRSIKPDLSRPALIQLRLRALTGVSARAEVLRLLLAEPARLQSASELASDAGYGKGNVAATLDTLVMSGIVEAQRAGNQLKHNLARQRELIAVLGGIPPIFPKWPSIFRVITALLSARGAGAASPIARAAEIRRLLRSVDDDLRSLGLADDLPKATGEALTVDFAAWALHLLRGWAAVHESSSGSADAEYTVHRLSTGDWLSTVADTGEAPRPITLAYRDESHGESTGSDSVIAADPDGAPRLAQAMLVDAERRAGPHSGTFRAVDLDDQEISRAFADERLWPMRPGQAATFSGDFLRRWVVDRRQRLVEKPSGRGARRRPQGDSPEED